jgi:hypothetical protein
MLWIAGALGVLVLSYVIPWVATRAYFDNKMDYNQRLLRQLERRS